MSTNTLERKPVDGPATLSMFVLCAVWGLQQVVVKAAAPDISPILQTSVRSGTAAILVGLLMWIRRERPSFAGGEWKPGLLVGFLFALEFLLVGEGLRHTTASHAVMFLYTAPVFAALGLHWRFPSERLRPLQWTGIALALAGIATTFSGRGGLGDVLALLGGVAWGATTVVVRSSRLANAPATQTLLYQLLGAFVLLLAAAFSLGQTRFNPSPLALGSLLFQTVVVSFASFLVWFGLLRKYLASRLGVLSFMTPLFGIAFGVGLLNEPLEASFLAGAALVFVGILMVSGYEWLTSLVEGAQPSHPRNA
ncbi:DMT family transporter [bacterium]|nr:MAG: DMT family transporter [bacterium]